MTMRRSLELLLAADIPNDLPTLEASMREISARIHVVNDDPAEYERAHRRLNELLTARDRLRAEAARAPGGRVKLR